MTTKTRTHTPQPPEAPVATLDAVDEPEAPVGALDEAEAEALDLIPAPEARPSIFASLSQRVATADAAKVQAATATAQTIVDDIRAGVPAVEAALPAEEETRITRELAELYTNRDALTRYPAEVLRRIRTFEKHLDDALNLKRDALAAPGRAQAEVNKIRAETPWLDRIEAHFSFYRTQMQAAPSGIRSQLGWAQGERAWLERTAPTLTPGHPGGAAAIPEAQSIEPTQGAHFDPLAHVRG